MAKLAVIQGDRLECVIARAPRLTPLLIGVLGFAGAVSPLATDMYLASFGSIQDDLATSSAQVQLTLAAFFWGNAFGQLLIGALSDMWGRRRLIVSSLTIYAALSVGLVFVHTIEAFIVLRLLLGFIGSAGIVLARAIAVDLDKGETAVRALSLIAMVGALGPLIAPPIGGFTHELWGWRGTLATLATLAITSAVLAWIFVPESLPANQRRTGGLLATYRPLGGLVSSRRYVGFLLAFVFGFSAMISYITASPFVGQNVLGMPPLIYAFGFSASGVALVLSNIANARVAPRVGARRMLGVGITLLLAASTSMLTLSLTGLLSVPSFIITAFVLTAGTGFILSNASALALAEAPHARGLAAALLGSVQFGFAGVLAPITGMWGEDTAVPLGFVTFGAAIVTALFALFAMTAAKD